MSGTTPAKSWKSQRGAQRGVYPREIDVRAVEDSQPASQPTSQRWWWQKGRK
jgi:hypothetical protein